MYSLMLMFLLSGLSESGNVAAGDSAIERYWWVWAGDTLGVLEVPAHPKVMYDEYGEGVVFTLSYPDSSFIELHFGGDIRLPIIDDSDCVVDSAFSANGATTRVGHIKDTFLFWCEVNRKNLINILFCNVRKARLPLFKDALATFQPWRH